MIYKSAKYGLNFNPELYPHSFQTSAKTIEYCPVGLGVISNRFNWAEEFMNERRANFLWLKIVNCIEDVFTFPNVVPEIKDMEWNSLLDGIGFDKFLLSVLLNQKQI
jgi:hypothetical protein